MTIAGGFTDEELALRSSQGDREAFSVLYERHYRGVYDLAMRMLRGDEATSDVVQTSFLNAWLNLQKRKVTGNVRAWLYTIARNAAINETRRNRKLARFDEQTQESRYAPVFAQVDADRLSDPESIAQHSELADLVWSSAAALNPKEYSLLDLHLRRGLSAEDLSRTLGVSKGNLHTKLSRLRDSLEESVTVSVLMRRGRGDCPDLNDLFAAAGAGFTPDLRKGVAIHLRHCVICQESRKRFLAPAEIFAGLALIPAPVEAARPLWIGATAGGGALAFVVGLLLTPVRWVWQLLQTAGAPAKAAAGAAVATTVAAGVVAAAVLGPSADGPPPLSAPGIAPPRVARSSSPHPPPSSPGSTPRVSATPVVAAAVATPSEIPTPTSLIATVVPAIIPASSPAITSTPTPPPPLAATATPAPSDATPAVVQILIGNGKGQEPDSPATISITILGSPFVPVDQIDIATVLLKGAAAENAKVKDVNDDGALDLRLHFKLPKGAVSANDEICVVGYTFSGLSFVGCDIFGDVVRNK